MCEIIHEIRVVPRRTVRLSSLVLYIAGDERRFFISFEPCKNSIDRNKVKENQGVHGKGAIRQYGEDGMYE